MSSHSDFPSLQIAYLEKLLVEEAKINARRLQLSRRH